jgi:hypothetical protein
VQCSVFATGAFLSGSDRSEKTELVLRQNRFLAIFLGWLVLSTQCFAYGAVYSKNYSSTLAGFDEARALQAAEILGIRSQIDRLSAAQGTNDSQSDETLLLRSIALRKILRAVLEVRQACNRIDLELAYTYDILQKEQRREHFIYQLFNLADFAQLSAFYTLEPYLRIRNQFVASAVCTTTSGSLGTAITSASRLYGHLAKASKVAPPILLAGIVDGRPVDTTGLPPLVTKFLDSPAPGTKISRRDELFATWKRRYHIDASKPENLCGIADKKKASTGLLNTRILLLWSLHTIVQDFDYDLLALLKMVKGPDDSSSFSNGSLNSGKYTTGELEVVRLLNIQPQVEELMSLKQSGTESKRRDELELFVLRKTLEGALEVQVASDKVDDELYYNYHVVLSSLLESRARWLQYNYNLNFLQSGIMGIIAGRLYLSRWSSAGDRQFVISGGIGTGLTTLAILQMHGFWRKVDTDPNSLGEVLNLHPPSEYRFSPFVSSFLNAVPPDTNGLTRRESLNKAWEQAKVTTMNLKRPKNRLALAAMPPHKYDTIKIVSNRNTLLHSLKKELESFQVEVLALLRATE